MNADFRHHGDDLRVGDRGPRSPGSWVTISSYFSIDGMPILQICTTDTGSFGFTIRSSGYWVPICVDATAIYCLLLGLENELDAHEAMMLCGCATTALITLFSLWYNCRWKLRQPLILF